MKRLGTKTLRKIKTKTPITLERLKFGRNYKYFWTRLCKTNTKMWSISTGAPCIVFSFFAHTLSTVLSELGYLISRNQKSNTAEMCRIKFWTTFRINVGLPDHPKKSYSRKTCFLSKSTNFKISLWAIQKSKNKKVFSHFV